VRLLLDHGANVELCRPKGCSAIYTACNEGHLAIVKELTKAGADLNAVRPNNHLPLHWMARRGSIEVSKQSICGVRRLGSASYRDALCRAAMVENFTKMRELVSAEGGVHVRGAKTKIAPMITPLHYTAGYCHPFAMSLLLEAGADETVVDSSGKTPL
ncbi:unnamed protein product, partial [Laminaria digitata]